MASGGKRKGAGRKPAKDPKKHFNIFVKTSIIEKNGGEEIFKKKLYTIINKLNG